MCEYCEKERTIEEQENDNIHLSIYGKHLKILGKVPMMHINFGRDIIINFCPMCRKRVERS